MGFIYLWFCHIHLKLFHLSQNEANCFLKWSSKFRGYAISRDFLELYKKPSCAHLMMCKSAYELLVFCCIFYAVCSKLANFCHLRPIVDICPQDARIDPESSCHDPPGWRGTDPRIRPTLWSTYRVSPRPKRDLKCQNIKFIISLFIRAKCRN